MTKDTNSGRILVGTSSWSDRSLTQDSDWYPRKTMRAAERMAYYSERFPLVEMENTFRFPPTVAVTEQWVERTPPGFRFDIPAWSLLTGQATFPPSLYEDLVNEVRGDARDKPKLYANHLSDTALQECWTRFVHALHPLQDADRLGTVILKYPRWLKPGASSRAMLERARTQLGSLTAAVELEHHAWFDNEHCEETFSVLEDLDFAFVCVDAPADHPRTIATADATTNGTAFLRLLGRRPRDPEGWREDYRSYRYDDEDLDSIQPRIEHLAAGSDEVHVLFSTCWRDDAVRNGEALQARLRREDRLAG